MDLHYCSNALVISTGTLLVFSNSHLRESWKLARNDWNEGLWHVRESGQIDGAGDGDVFVCPAVDQFGREVGHVQMERHC